MNNESNATENLYRATPVSSSSDSSVVSSDSSASLSASSSASVESSATSSSASAESSLASSATALADKPLDERTVVQDIDEKTKNITVTEKNGDRVSAQLQAPSYKKALQIDARRTLVVSEEGTNGVRMTPVDFQEGLAELFFNLEVNDKPAGKVNFDLANDHREAYKVFMDKADSFLTAFLDAD